MRIRASGVAGTSAVLVLALAVAACGDDDDAEEGLTGPPIEIGFMNVEDAPAGDFSDIRLGAEAAVEFVNGELGGVDGRPLELDSCAVNGSGESSISCANEFVRDGKVAVSYGIDFGAAGGVPVLAEAGIPIVGGLPSESAQLTGENAFAFVGAAAGAVPAVARYAGEVLKVSKVGILALDLPAARNAVDDFARPVLASYGVTDVEAVFEAPNASDWAPALSKAADGDPGAILVLVAGSACERVMQGTVSLDIPRDRLVYLQTCTAEATLEAGGDGAEGISVQAPFLSPTSDSEQVQTWRAAMEKYRPDARLGSNAQSGFNSIMNLRETLREIDGDITAESITAAFRAAKDRPSFMGHPYTCDGQQIPGLRAICNANERILKIEDGAFVDLSNTWYEGASRLPR